MATRAFKIGETTVGTITTDAKTQIPRIDIEFNMSPAAHYRWNIVEAARTLVRTPEEQPITLMVYKIHKGVLRNKGVSEEVLARGDKHLVKRVEMLVRKRNEFIRKYNESNLD